MSIAEQITENGHFDLDVDARITLELPLTEAEALRTWLLKPAADGTTSLDDPVLNGILTKLGRAVDVVRATVNVRRELQQAGLEVGHLSDEQVRELGRRVADAAQAGIRG
jgi:hypothetical protein